MISNHRVLTGVFIPVAAAWIEFLIERNWSRVRDSIAEGEQAIASESPLRALEDVTAEPATTPASEEAPGALLASMAGGDVVRSPQAKTVIEQLHAAFNPGVEPREGDSILTVRIGDLSAEVIKSAGEAGQALAVTHARELIGVVIPVTQDLVQFLISQNVSSILHNIGLSEKELEQGDRLLTLDQLEQSAEPGRPEARAASVRE